MYKHLLVPLDESQRAERAVLIAARIAETTGARMTLLQVISPPTSVGALYAPVDALSMYPIEQTKAEASAYLKRVAGSPPLCDLQVERVAMIGAPALAILDTIRVYSVDLVVISSHGRTGALRWALGSVAEHIARQSPAPVLVLRGQEPVSAYPHHDPTQPLCILTALDGSLLAEAALAPSAELVLALAGPGSAMRLPQTDYAGRTERAAMRLILVLPPYEADHAYLPDALALEGARMYLERTADRLRAAYPELSVSWSVASGFDIAATLAAPVAESGDHAERPELSVRSDLMGMATHGRSGIRRWALGSVTERVLHSTQLPLLIVRPPAVAAPTRRIETGAEVAARSAG